MLHNWLVRMKNTFFALLVVMTLCFSIMPCSAALAAQQNPQSLVKDFYAWYIEEMKDFRNVPIKNDAIYKYVYACTVNKCRINIKQGLVYSDYFLCSNDFDYESFKKMLTVYNPVRISDDVSLVPVGNDKLYIVVFVQKTKEGWRIIKVENVFQMY